MSSTEIVSMIQDQQDDKSRHPKKSSTRPALQIYRPPNLRSDQASTAPQPKPQPNLTKTNVELREISENNVKMFTVGGYSTEPRRLNRTESSLSSESGMSQKSSSSGSTRATAPREPTTTTEKKKQTNPPKKEAKRKVMVEKDILDASQAIRALQMTSNTAETEQWIAGGFVCPEMAECIGSSLCHHAIEGGGGRGVAKVCGLLKNAESVQALHKGLSTSISQYFECRDKLRADHFRMWISFLNFVSDLYSSMGGGEGEFINYVFQIFSYLLKAPVLESLKIEELECLISALLSIGYEIERECPDQLALLKDLIRDAFIEVTEPWARKMILLLLELGASGWKLPPEANEYYFQQNS